MALVLSGGGARGFSEIAVLEMMEKYGIPVDMVLGTSMGALIGSLYSVGMTPKEISTYVETHNLMNILLQPASDTHFFLPDAFSQKENNIISVGFSTKGVGSAPGLLGDQKLLAMLNELYAPVGGVTDFDSLPVPFRAVATDAISGERIVYDHGSLVTAVRSSISLPLVFSPYPQPNGSLAMDGGMSDNIPIKLAKDLGATYVVAVDVNADQRLAPEELDSLTAAASQSLVIVTQTNSVPQYALADILLDPAVGTFGTLAFNQYDQILEAGRQCCLEHEDQFRKLAKELENSGRELEVLDPDRKGTYGTGNARVVRNVAVVDHSSSGSMLHLTPRDFDSFVGLPFDESNRKRLDSYLERLRVSYQLSSISYEMVNNDDGTMDLIINSTSYSKPQSWFTIGGWSSFGFSNNSPSTFGWVLFDAREQLFLSNLTKGGLALKIYLSQGNSNGGGISLTVPFYNKGSQYVGLEVGGDLFFGSLTTKTVLAYGNRTAAKDSGGNADFSFTYHYGDYVGVKLSALVNWVYQSSKDRNVLLFMGSVSCVADTRHQDSLCQRGMSVHSDFRIGTDLTGLRWALKISYRQDFVIQQEKQAIGYSLSFFTQRLPQGLLLSYQDIGGINGLPGYALATYRQDYCSVALNWRYRVATVLGCPLYVMERLEFALMNQENPFDDGYASGSPFANNLFDVGLMSMMAAETPVGNFGVGFGFSVRGKVTFAIGVVE